MRKDCVMVFTALALGLAWAIRGHFGHEWGASWAGGVGGLALLVAVRDARWMRRAPTLAALCAIGWGAGGMMSYGRVIGYTRGADFLNVWYGFSMLAVIGGLYGFIGGGLFGLGLESTETRKPRWASLMAEMVAGAWLAWGLLIYQLQWFMTPPRSELWAACLGAAAALGWHLHREGYPRALRVAAYSTLGAGFGFAFGNLFQIMGASWEIPYNWWNVMEFTLGFCGGLGMAYGVVTREWPEPLAPSRIANWLALLFLLLAIPMTNHIKAIRVDRLTNLGESLNIADVPAFMRQQQTLGWILAAVLLAGGLLAWKRFQDEEKPLAAGVVPGLFFGYLGVYTLFSFITDGMFHRRIDLSMPHTLYLPIVVVLAMMWAVSARKEPLREMGGPPETAGRWVMIVGGVLVALLVISAAAISMHEEPLGGSHERFPRETAQQEP